jgi:hypothetical protein
MSIHCSLQQDIKLVTWSPKPAHAKDNELAIVSLLDLTEFGQTLFQLDQILPLRLQINQLLELSYLFLSLIKLIKKCINI